MGARLLVHNIGLLATPVGSAARKGAEQGEIAARRGCHVVVEGGVITEIGDDPPGIAGKFAVGERLDAAGRLVTPGLIDCHTHAVFGGWRHGELALKLAGASYLDVLAAGGGILSTVARTREASFGELFEKTRRVLDECLSHGVTTIEAKSGYGLDAESEIKCLEVLKKLDEEHPADVAPTFMGAHAIPEESRDDRGAFVALVADRMLPLVAERGLAGFCDVFCEKGAFTLEESRLILSRAKSLGMGLRIHADEINNLGGSLLAAELGCATAEHLIRIDGAGIRAMSEAGVVAVCLPCTSLYLNEGFAPAREMIAAGVPVAVATDFNPGSSPSMNLQLAMSMACCKYKMTPAEILTATTLNAAAAVGRAALVGSLEVGKQADMAVWDAEDLDYIFYRFGSNLASAVVKRGAVASRGGRITEAKA